MRQIAARSGPEVLPKEKPVAEHFHRLFEEFPVSTVDELVRSLEKDGQGIDIFKLEGVPHLACGRPFVNIFVQTDAVKHLPGDLLAIYQYCIGCKIAVRVL